MRNVFTWLGGPAVVALLISGCSSESAGADGEEKGNPADASIDGGENLASRPDLSIDGGESMIRNAPAPGAMAPRECKAMARPEAPFQPLFRPADASPKACSKETFAEFKKSCIDEPSKCQEWRTANDKNRACASCTDAQTRDFQERWGLEVLVSTDPLVFRDNSFEACLELFGASKAATQCAEYHQVTKDCVADACYSCLVPNDRHPQYQDARTVYPRFAACMKSARETVCSGYAKKESCAKPLLAAGSKAAACNVFLGNDDDKKNEMRTKVLQKMCSPG